MMFPGTLNSSTLQPSARALFAEGSVFLLWKILQSTGGTGMGLFGLGLVLRPRDFNSKLSCKLNSIPRAMPRRSQARQTRKLRRSHIALLWLQTKS
ncbi:hypothetical protein N332_00731, partial [Mesitornis unicolor]